MNLKTNEPMNPLYSNRKNKYRGLTVDRIKREQMFENLTDREVRTVITILEKYSIGMFPEYARSRNESIKIKLP